MVLILKNVEISGKWRFFRADMARLGIYHMGRYGQIGVYRVKMIRYTFNYNRLDGAKPC